MEQKKFEKILNSLYPNLKVISYQLWDRYTMGDDGEFVKPQKPAIFVEVKGDDGVSIGSMIGEDISRMTGLEVILDKIG